MYRKNAAMKVKAFDFDIKAVNDDGLFSGYGSVFDVVDSFNEVVAPGAFLESIEETRAKGERSLFSGSIAPANQSGTGISRP